MTNRLSLPAGQSAGPLGPREETHQEVSITIAPRRGRCPSLGHLGARGRPRGGGAPWRPSGEASAPVDGHAAGMW